MRVTRIHQAGEYQVGDTFALNKTAVQHAAVALRLQAGDQLILFKGDNQEFQAVITLCEKKRVDVKILAAAIVNKESPQPIHLAQSLAKGDKMELIVQKAVELGVSSITPLITERTNVKLEAARLAKKNAQWQDIAIAACEQSGRNIIPQIMPVIDLRTYLAQKAPGISVVLSPQANNNWRNFNFARQPISLLIGPEGGISTAEMTMLISYGYNELSLGPRILRTETAAIAALSVLQAVSGDL